jgi:hypothetical protein
MKIVWEDAMNATERDLLRERDRVEALHSAGLLGSPKEEAFDRITRLITSVMDVPIAAFSLVDESRQWFKSIYGLDLEDTPRAQAFCAYTILSDSFVVPDALADHRFATNPLVVGAPHLRAYAGVPIHYGEHKIGALCGIDTKPRQFSEKQMSLLRDLADVVQDYVNWRISSRAELDGILKATINALTRTMEMRDPYTAGHEERTGRIAVAIGQELGWTKHRLDGLWLASAVHDTGKMSIPLDLLKKPDRLSAAEFEIIRAHPSTGYRILQTISFPWPIADIVHQHHEKLDGTGYPNGLSGNRILPEAQIVSIADIVESMWLDRPYRTGLGIDAALKEVERLSGSKLDPELCRVCLKLFRQDGFHLLSQN